MTSRLRVRLRQVREKIASRLLPPHVTSDLNRNDRVGALHRAWGHVFTSQIEGAYYEFGVYRGDTFRDSFKVYQGYFRWQQAQITSPEPWRQKVAATYARYRHHFYAFDTFKGTPPNEEKNVTFAEGTFFCSLDEFKQLNRAVGIVESDQVRYFAGTFAETRVRQTEELERMQPAAIANLDCDLYSSATDALAIIGPKLVRGSVLLVDDWNTFAARRDSGERLALAEFLSQHPEFELEPWFAYMYTGQAFLVHITR